MICIRHTLLSNPWYIERERLDKYLDIIVEAVNFLLLDIQRIVLVEDPMRTIKVCLSIFVHSLNIFEC
jgi:hypothetical protein